MRSPTGTPNGIRKATRAKWGTAARKAGLATPLLAILLSTVCVAPALAEPCSNEAIRQQQGVTGLPDCRAYEMVTPVEKGGSAIHSGLEASSSGERLLYSSPAAFGESAGSPPVAEYLATRGVAEWQTEPLSPREKPISGITLENLGEGVYNIVSDELTSGVLTLAGQDPPLVPAQPRQNFANLYLRNFSESSFSLLTPPRQTPSSALMTPVWMSGDHVIYEADDGSFAPGASDAPNVYESIGGQLRAVDVLPDGTPAAAAVVGSGVLGTTDVSVQNAVSSDGSRIYFTELAEQSGQYVSFDQLYVRENGVSTREVSTSQRATPDPHGPQGAFFRTASSDGSKVYFTSQAELTDDANTGTEDQGTDLYQYDLASNKLIDISADAVDQSGAQVIGVVGSGEDATGAYAYFVAEGTLASGATAGQPNLYVWHDNGTSTTTEFIATLAQGDERVWQPFPSISDAEVDQSGRQLVFLSHQSLTGYANAGYSEVYMYAAGSKRVECLSCASSGAPASGNASLRTGVIFGQLGLHHLRNISSDGSQVFFNSPDALVRQDTNGRVDVYEWENGQLSLISSGHGASNSYFADASASGRDVFFLTNDQLVAQDQDSLADVYDARLEGGFPPPPTSPLCSGSGCQGVPPAPPIFATPPSVTYNGIGNFAPPVKTAVKAKKKPKPKRKSAKKAKRGKRKATRSHGNANKSDRRSK